MVTIGRAKTTLTFPGNLLVIGAMSARPFAVQTNWTL